MFAKSGKLLKRCQMLGAGDATAEPYKLYGDDSAWDPQQRGWHLFNRFPKGWRRSNLSLYLPKKHRAQF